MIKYLLFFLFITGYVRADELTEKLIKKIISPNLVMLSDNSIFAIEAIYIPKNFNLSIENIYIKRLHIRKEKSRYLYNLADINLIDNLSVQEFLLSKGLSYIYYINDNNSFDYSKLLEIESYARDKKKGLWKYKKILSAKELENNLKFYINRFVIFEGTVTNIYITKKSLFINFGKNWKTDTSVLIKKKDLMNFKSIDFKKIENKKIIARGWLEYYKGPLIKAENFSHLQVIN